LLAVAALLTVAAALAIGILLFGDFGSTEGRILATTALLAGYGLFCLPAAMLHDRRQAPLLAAGVAALALWADLDSERYGRAFGALVVLNVLLVALQPILARARTAERDGLRVLRVEFPDASAESDLRPTPQTDAEIGRGRRRERANLKLTGRRGAFWQPEDVAIPGDRTTSGRAWGWTRSRPARSARGLGIRSTPRGRA
jgi:hypothetical protein